MHPMDASASCGDACRLCDENKEKMYSIFAKNDEGQQILHLIKECLPLIIFRTDPLSKQICEDCFNKLETFYRFKKTSLDTAKKHRNHLRNTEESSSKSVQLYLACEDAEVNEVINSNNIPEQTSIGTSTDDLTISCINCKSTYFDSSIINSEVELCAELHKAIADSLSNNKVITHTESEKVVRSRRRRSQAFYHELDDSLCSSLTEFTNTESSQCYEEYHSEVESYESDSEDLERAKRRKLDPSIVLNIKEKNIQGEKDIQDVQVLKTLFRDEVEYRYFPLSLMTLALNVVNKKIVPGHEPDEFYEKVVEPQCTYCREKFKNSKLLALHEVDHINIELGEKVDNPIPWHESRDDAHIRNKWLNSYDEVECEEDPADYMECEVETAAGESLLIPVGTEVPQEHKSAGDILLVMAKPVVNGIALSDYSKEERKAFYKSMKIGGVNKKFCSLCRYSFKDNWAIESHYFSLACYYTCRYCGMRFNKQRHRFDEHVREHEERGDPLSTKIYAASKLNNFVPRIIQPDKVKKMVAQHDQEQNSKIKVKNFSPRRNLPPNIRIKEEKMDSDGETQPPPVQKTPTTVTKTSNQAYFCRKCYKVFFKLDEFNIHSKNCDYNQFPQGRNNMNKFPNKFGSNGEMVSSSGRPVRHCVRETGTYKDETYIPDNMLKETSQSQQSFVCFICNTPFPTIYSRNSHMRIHKGEANHNNRSPVVSQKTRQSYHSDSVPSFSNYIKQEPLEPEIQIHESEQNYNSSSSIGSVSITPISKNPNQKATINPNIMKLVQNNPHLTIKANKSPERQPVPSASSMQNNLNDSDKSYKCSSCWEAFANKSHLYFHKKNQCEGSKYPCPFCKKRFGTEAAYSSHIFYSHPE
ncbi:uncharacterized protein BDFB_004101 [Asbolus verrucosus]|uniref:Uncharacterized protein n=1 Tax=Asbolus verrucosus TaxID=1661398 RepID=A0A482VRC3_ASBVE|nr:uncharacterized protein BDFB_004101 [Asbolus verrucosus]